MQKHDEAKLKSRMMSGAAVLAIGSIVAKLLGALYRIPLTNILGAQGMGMYQLVFPVFALFTVLATAGIPTALSRIVAEKRVGGEPTKKYLFSAMLTLGALGAIFAIITFALSGQLAKWQGNSDTRLGFVIIAPTVVLVVIIAGFRGWFQGEMYMIPTAVSNIIEQAVKLGAGIGLSLLLKPRGVIAAVNGALLGLAISEVCALIYLIIVYFVRGKNLRGEKLRLMPGEARNFFKMSFPIAVVALMMPLSNFSDSVIIVNMLKLSGVSEAAATAEYGLLCGPVNSLINMPIVLIMSLAVAIVPSVSVSRVKMDIDGIMLKSKLSVKLSYLIGVPAAFFFGVFAKRIMATIYPALSIAELSIAINLLRISSANIVLLSSMQIYVSLLQALDKTGYAIVSMAIAITIKIVLSLLLTRYVGILGAALAAVTMSVAAYVGVNICYFKICGLHLEKNIGLNLLTGVIMGLVGIGVGSLIKNDIVATAVGFLVCAALYVWLVFLFGLLGREELEYLPMRRLLCGLHRIVRFWEYRDEIG